MDTFRRIVSLIAKWILVCIIAIAALAAVIGGGFFGYYYMTYQRHAENIEMAVITTVCGDDKWPLLVSIQNHSGRTLLKASFILEARRKGFSTNIATYDRYYDDRIREPGDAPVGTCWAAPLATSVTDNPRNLEWTITSRNFEFK